MSSEAQNLSKCFHDFYRLGLTTSSGGNVSSRTSDDLICISPSQIDKGFLKTEDFCYLNLKSEIIGANKPSMEYPFHLAVYNQFPDISTILHFHPPVFVALSLLPEYDSKLLDILEKFNIGYTRYAIPGSDKLGQVICDTIGKGSDFVLMQNHGMLAVGKNLEKLSEEIINLNDKLIDFLNLNEFNKSFSPKSYFKEEFEESSDFYEKRANHFLNLKSQSQFSFNKWQDSFYTHVQLNSLKKLGSANFKANIIPESFLLLKNAEFQDRIFAPRENVDFLGQSKNDIFIFRDGHLLLKGSTLYNLYDKLEVLDFTAKVLLFAEKIGNYQLLNNDQLNALEERFFNH